MNPASANHHFHIREEATKCYCIVVDLPIELAFSYPRGLLTELTGRVPSLLFTFTYYCCLHILPPIQPPIDIFRFALELSS